MLTVQQTFALALQEWRSGRWDEAGGLCERILAVKPDHAEALHLLGLVAQWKGVAERAVELIRRAIANDPAVAEYHNSLGNAWQSVGRVEEAMAAYGRALQVNSGHAAANYNLGAIFQEEGRHEEAARLLLRALQAQPRLAPAYHRLAIALEQMGRLEEGLGAARRAIELQPQFAEAHQQLGAMLTKLHRLEEAEGAFRRALELRPDYVEAWSNLGFALASRDRLEEAAAALRRAVELRPDLAEGQQNLAGVLFMQGRLEEAIAAYRAALALRPDYADALNNLANALQTKGELDEAEGCIRQMISWRPQEGAAWGNLGAILKNQGRVEEAMEAYRRGVELSPGSAKLRSAYIYTALYFEGSSREAMVAAQREWNREFGEPLGRGLAPHANDRTPGRRLRIGYVSENFRDHVEGRYLRPLFRHRDRAGFEIVCYADVAQADAWTAEFRSLADIWRNTRGSSDEQLAALVRSDGVDVLVDLSQHMAGDRLGCFARKPAPVQASFAGYPDGTGLEAIGHRITGRFLENEGRGSAGERLHTIDTFWCYDPGGVALPVGPSPALGSGQVTFGNLNNFSKVNPPLLRWWGQVLREVPGSRLLLLTPAGSHRARALRVLESEGVEASRVEFAAPRRRPEYMALYHRLDAVLDSYPYNGHSTSLDGLWMGVPLVTLAGETSVSRAGLSQLRNLGLPELIAGTPEEYVRRAVELGNDGARLAELRAKLRPRLEASALMDGAHFARQIEAAYRAMWAEYCLSGR